MYVLRHRCKAVLRNRRRKRGIEHVVHDLCPHWVADAGGIRSIIMSIIICIMAMWSAII